MIPAPPPDDEAAADEPRDTVVTVVIEETDAPWLEEDGDRGATLPPPPAPKEVAPPSAKHSACTVLRTVLVTHKTVTLGTGEVTARRQAWETKPCGASLWSDEERLAGVCRVCTRGWSHPNNYRADGPRPTDEIAGDPVASAKGGA